ncbi:hypothetical protein Tco_0448328 [Tanacetum coccineum]
MLLDFEEDVFDDELQRNEAILLSDEEIALDACSEGTLSPGGPRFDKPPDQNAHIDMPFPNSLLTDQQKDLEYMVSKEEVKRAVWDCGTDKSPGPDGFTFGFYRHFWSTIENDVFEAVKYKVGENSPKSASLEKVIVKIKSPFVELEVKNVIYWWSIYSS